MTTTSPSFVVLDLPNHPRANYIRVFPNDDLEQLYAAGYHSITPEEMKKDALGFALLSVLQQMEK